MDGRSAYSPTGQNRRALRILQRNTFKVLRFPVGDFERKKALVRERNQRLFGTGARRARRGCSASARTRN